MKTRHWVAGFRRTPRFVPRPLFRSTLCGLASLCLAVAQVPAQPYSVLHSFDGANGANPYAGLVWSGLTLYGTASSGGSSNCGVVFRLALPRTPTILTPPADQTAVIGSSASFSVDALGTAPLAYQWGFNGTNAIAWATEAALQLTNVQPDQAGAYAVVITNTFGAVTSPPTWLSVVPVTRTVTNCTEAALRAALGGRRDDQIRL